MGRETVIERLRANADALGRRGVRSASLFGSLARGEAVSGSDIDIAVILAPELSLIDIAELRVSLRDLLGGSVDLVEEPARRPGLQAAIERDRIRAF